jgi:hypothetical protein
MARNNFFDSLLLPALLLVLLACKSAPVDGNANPADSANTASQGKAPALGLDGLSLEHLEKGSRLARWKVRSSSEAGDDKSLRTLSLILEEKYHDGYITLFRFTDNATDAAAAKLGKRRALLVTSPDPGENEKTGGAAQLLQALLHGGDVDKVSRETLKQAAKEAGWKVESSHLDTYGDEGVGYTMLEMDLAKEGEYTAIVQLYEYEKSASAGRAVQDGARVLIVSVPDKQRMAQPLLARIAEAKNSPAE